MSRQKPRQRGGRVPDKATPEQVMGLARNLPLTHSVPGKALEDATPGGMDGNAPVRQAGQQAHVRPLAADAHVRQVTGQAGGGS